MNLDNTIPDDNYRTITMQYYNIDLLRGYADIVVEQALLEKPIINVTIHAWCLNKECVRK